MREEISVGLAVNTIEPHPHFLFRFNYDDTSVNSLARSIEHLGQLQNGRVVPKPDASGYLVYVGIRRYFAVKRLYQGTRDPRFARYCAVIDDGLSEAEMFARAIGENMQEKGERKGLSLLEEVAVFGREAKLLRSNREVLKMLGRDEDFLSERLALASKLDEERLRQLYLIEEAADFRFRIGHLQELAKTRDEREFLLVASLVAEGGLKVSQVDYARTLPERALSIDWFGGLFPKFAKENPTVESGLPPVEKAPAGAAEKIPGKAKSSEPGKESKPGAVLRKEGGSSPGAVAKAFYEVNVLFARCPFCSAENPCKLEHKEEVTFFHPKPEGIVDKTTVSPEAVYIAERTCFRCEKRFFMLISPREGQIAAEVRKRRTFLDLRAAISVGSLDWDDKEDRWVKLAGSTREILAS